ncbi:hypothetical protein M9H77_34725 [Catharanthus roseus]|uniref:Uncharacterized protein n=1 Tax=Catharanthus roseus TaxID=4058 RepID=A0ACB9ZMQ9_CATRO|nr:hypothetical protein M9H77_34725 [Catharanthus roseus]
MDERCEEVRVKPESAELEVDLAVDVDSKNYDRDADPRVLMPKQTLTSSSKSPIATRYAVGVLVRNKLHLNPVDAVVQLRPSLQHLKPESARKKTNNLKEAVKEEVKEEKSIGSAKKQNKPSSALKEQNKSDEKDWISLKYRGARSDASARYLQKMIEQDESPLQFSMNRYNIFSLKIFF